jgi:hypothetical protein
MRATAIAFAWTTVPARNRVAIFDFENAALLGEGALTAVQENS